MHRLGFIYCDLKPENILLGSSDFSDDRSSDICLVDFGVTKPYVDYLGEHLKEE